MPICTADAESFFSEYPVEIYIKRRQTLKTETETEEDKCWKSKFGVFLVHSLLHNLGHRDQIEMMNSEYLGMLPKGSQPELKAGQSQSPFRVLQGG